MNPKKSTFFALIIALNASRASAAEAVWPGNSASDLSIFVTLLRFQIHADHCSSRIPQLKPEFESLMESLSIDIQRVSKDLLASDVFKGMKDKPVPAEIVAALHDSFEDTRHNFERRDASSICAKELQNLREMDDNSLKSGLTEALSSVQNMIRKLEEGIARQ